jgi:bifunctional non-homologous end joining protein LigD
MALEEYRKKRNFSKTLEPAGETVHKSPEGETAHKSLEGESPPKSGLLYVIQKHAARALHYDFRLELDGVLLSWAVPKGPSLNPRDRHLAVRVEDHPLEYGSFEGSIPPGEYGAGTVQLWDRGTWEPEGDPRAGLTKGDLKFALHGEKLRGSWVLVRMKPRPGQEGKENWLLIKHRDEYAVDSDGRAILQQQDRSVASGRNLEEIAAEAEASV